MNTLRPLRLFSAACCTKNINSGLFCKRKYASLSSIDKISMSPKEHLEHAKKLAAQRPSSPHFTIYQPQLTWLMSIVHRVTGAGLATLFYGAGIAYGLCPIKTSELVTICQQVPNLLWDAGKIIVTAPFVYHILNGIRHLIWDVGLALSMKGVYTTGWMVNIGTLIGTFIIFMKQ